jgi:glycosyltransferase involved in cell wall biosynthesis
MRYLRCNEEPFLIHGKKIVVVLPAFNAERTLERTRAEIPRDVVDDVILVDDGSVDGTVALARRLGIRHATHGRNLGYGANQKTCYALALREGADVVVMVHPDYQYPPRMITPMAGMIASGEHDVVLGSRILGSGALEGGMPLYKFVGNRFLTLSQNLLIGQNLSTLRTTSTFSPPGLSSGCFSIQGSWRWNGRISPSNTPPSPRSRTC